MQIVKSFKYWDDCIDPDDMKEMCMDPEVSNEWIHAGESTEKKVHLSRDPDGQVFLTQTEMQAVAEITVHRHFKSKIDQDMIRAIAELESDRQPLAKRYNKKAKDDTLGIMQILPKTAEWLVSEMGYKAYEITGDPVSLYKPFINVYLGAAYLLWLSNFHEKKRSEEFVVRAYRYGPKKATHKSTLDYWQKYLFVKQNLPSRREVLKSQLPLPVPGISTPITLVSQMTVGDNWKYWDSRASQEDMEDLWRHPDVLKEWTKVGEKQGKARFCLDPEKGPYVSRQELRAVAEIIVSKHFSAGGIKPAVLCALAEVCSMRFVYGAGSCIGIMGIDYPKAVWLYKDLGYKAYLIESVEDLYSPFVSIYLGAAYLVWLSEYEGRERTLQFVIQAYLSGPENVSLQETGPLWLKFENALSYYNDRRKKDRGSCTIM